MKYIHFNILDRVLCDAEAEPVPEKLANTRRLCNDCIQVIWKEQYSRSRFFPQEWVEKVDTQTELLPPKKIKPLAYYLKLKEVQLWE
jgi:hypothetical protein